MKYHFKKVEDFAGFSVENAAPGQTVKILGHATLTSDDSQFHNYVEQISDMYLSKFHILANYVYQFLILIHKDLSADLHVNEFPVSLEIRPKKDLAKGEPVYLKDIADIRKVKISDIKIVDTDKVIYCFKVGWRFGLYFNLLPKVSSGVADSIKPEVLDLEEMMQSTGTLYRYLSFYHVYKVLENGAQFEEMLKDGWFPFIEILANEYKELTRLYQDKFDFENRITTLVNKFDEQRVRTISDKWWSKQVFSLKKTLIQAGISAYLHNTQEGTINCIKNLCTEIEGILRELYRSEMGQSSITTEVFISYVIEKGKKASSDYSLLLPVPFLKYLKEVVFANFDVELGKVELSRHSSSHGVADVGKYTRERALQLILILDQISFYL